MNQPIDHCEHIRLTLIANAAAMQKCTKTEGVEVLIPATRTSKRKRILIGTDEYLAKVALPAASAAPAEPIYQAQFMGDPDTSDAWRDVTEAAYDAFPPERRRIVYVHDAATPSARQPQQFDQTEFMRLVREFAEVCYGERRTTEDVGANLVNYVKGLSAGAAAKTERAPCSACNGAGEYEHKGSDTRCRVCGGSGFATAAGAGSAQPEALDERAPSIPELRKAFMTLESSGGEGRTIVLKFNQRKDAYAVHDYLLKVGSQDWRASTTQQAGAAAPSREDAGLREAVRAITLLIKNREWADVLDMDADATALWDAVDDMMIERAALARAPLRGRGGAQPVDDARDAARYRWLREQPFETFSRIAFNTWDNAPFVWPYRDEFIDAAMRANDSTAEGGNRG